MNRILRMAGAAALALMTLGAVSACTPDDLKDVALPAVKSMAVKVAVLAAEGDSKAREIVLSVGDAYCDVPESDRLALREAFSSEGRAAFSVDCAAVAALRGRASAAPPITAHQVAALRTEPYRRE